MFFFWFYLNPSHRHLWNGPRPNSFLLRIYACSVFFSYFSVKFFECWVPHFAFGHLGRGAYGKTQVHSIDAAAWEVKEWTLMEKMSHKLALSNIWNKGLSFLPLWKMSHAKQLFTRLEKDIRFNYFQVRCARLLSMTLFWSVVLGAYATCQLINIRIKERHRLKLLYRILEKQVFWLDIFQPCISPSPPWPLLAMLTCMP